MIRIFDLVAAIFGLLVLSPLFLLVIIIGFFETGSPLFSQVRVGRNMKPFLLFKFRTMPVDTPSVASHLTKDVRITAFGSFLRRTKIDELPQLWNVLKGDMSLVGPRPNLFNQDELVEARANKDVYAVRPGITGLAQIQNIDMSNPVKLASTDSMMIKGMTLKNYVLYIAMTVTGSGVGDARKSDR